MYQVTFSDQSMLELNKLEMEDQLHLVDIISNITPEMLEKPKEPIGRFKRGKRTYFRVRAGEFRCYFEIRNDILYSHYILHKNTLTDYVFRNKLPVKDEQLVEQNQSFWQYIESLTK
ncbi:MAG: cytotoxic translational repressor of toxin-antitoxin stability system [Opitutales bacterium]|nr:cytotoxic translational repressor of toxin-antitoxin stability system [Opitutales bacterium]